MNRKQYDHYALTRPELELAVKRFIGLPDDAYMDSFTVKTESLAEPQPVCWIIIKVEEGIVVPSVA